jgi:prolyl-tRNA synthetase
MPLNLVEHSDKKSNLIMGFIGPSGLDASVKILADNSLKGCMDMVIGANKKDYHFTGANIGRDFEVGHWGDFSFPEEGDLCFKCGKPLEFEKGIEIGHIFKLGTRYSQKMNAVFLDSNGNLKPIIMGCYGIGVSRIISAAIEQLSDDRGIVWPVSIAPFTVNLIAINVEDPRVKNSADSIYEEMKNNGIEVIYDDRNVRAGVKFKDSDLLGIPIKLIVGKKYAENKKVEIELRKSGEKFELDLASALNFISGYSGKNLF